MSLYSVLARIKWIAALVLCVVNFFRDGNIADGIYCELLRGLNVCIDAHL